MTAVRHEDGICRCNWCGTDPVYVAYHDTEWGVPEYDSQALFEKLMLELAQVSAEIRKKSER